MQSVRKHFLSHLPTSLSFFSITNMNGSALNISKLDSSTIVTYKRKGSLVYDDNSTPTLNDNMVSAVVFINFAFSRLLTYPSHP